MNVQGDFNSEINDVESQLLQQFSCMSTSSKDDLIKEFQRLLAPNQLNGEGCAFFLDMNNWNLEKVSHLELNLCNGPTNAANMS